MEFWCGVASTVDGSGRTLPPTSSRGPSPAHAGGGGGAAKEAGPSWCCSQQKQRHLLEKSTFLLLNCTTNWMEKLLNPEAEAVISSEGLTFRDTKENPPTQASPVTTATCLGPDRTAGLSRAHWRQEPESLHSDLAPVSTLRARARGPWWVLSGSWFPPL